jgi:hypothetical protein
VTDKWRELSYFILHPSLLKMNAWTTFELHNAIRSKSAILRTPYGAGTLLSLRNDVSVDVIENDNGSGAGATQEPPIPSWCVVQLSFGKAFLRSNSSAIGPPPDRFVTGTRVRTPFGRGVVLLFRASMERIDYEVKLLDCKLSEGRTAVAYLSPKSVDLRTDLTFEESVSEATLYRNRGNEAFKQKDYDLAASEYAKCTEVLGASAVAGLTELQKNALRDGVTKALSNTAQCLLSRSSPNYAGALKAASDAIVISQGMSDVDPREAQRLGSKLRYRQGIALMGLGEWKAAIEMLSHPIHSECGDDSVAIQQRDEALKKLKEAKEMLKREEKKEKGMWSGAFAKLGEDKEKDASSESGSPRRGTSSSSSFSSSSSSMDTGARSEASPIKSPLKASPLSPISSTSLPQQASRKSILALKEENGVASGSSTRDGSAAASSSGDQTEEEVAEKEEEGWGSYLLYGGLAVGALALGALAVSAVMRKGGGSGGAAVKAVTAAALKGARR